MRPASCLYWVDAESAPFLIVHDGFDDLILAEQSRQMAAALYDAGVEVGYLAVPGVSHDGVMQWPRFGPLTLAFLETHLHPEQ